MTMGDFTKLYLNSEEIKRYFRNKKVYIFGTGVDTEKLLNKLADDYEVVAFIDNYRFGENTYFRGKRVINLSQYIDERDDDSQIIIASYQYAMEISNELISNNLKMGFDFFVWDEINFFHHNSVTREYVKFLTKIWGSYRKEDKNSQILIPYFNRHNLFSAMLAYHANYFAEKYDASIYAYFWRNSNYNNISEVVKDIYNAINVKRVIASELDEEQKNKAYKIFLNIWGNICTWEDWKNISVYGICFGTSIIRNLLRFNMPRLDVKDEKLKIFLEKEIYTIVYWYDYICNHDIKTVLLLDGATWDGYIRDIAITKEIPTYVVINGVGLQKATLNMPTNDCYKYFGDMWKELTSEEQRYGVEWAKEQLKVRIEGQSKEIALGVKNCFSCDERNNNILEINNKLKILICPHIFGEDSFHYGEQIFDNNYFSWLCHLGELSEVTPNYDWYIKMHPVANSRDDMIIDMIINKYPKIKKIPSNVSPMQLKKEGIQYALTVCGTIGHEYPKIGIQVINAGINPHDCYDFTWNPKTKEEYDELIFNLESLPDKTDEEGLYQFYSLNYLYYNWKYLAYAPIFFENQLLALYDKQLNSYGKEEGTWMYAEYMNEWTEKRHKNILEQLDDIYKKVDEWQPNILYKRDYTE